MGAEDFSFEYIRGIGHIFFASVLLRCSAAIFLNYHEYFPADYRRMGVPNDDIILGVGGVLDMVDHFCFPLHQISRVGLIFQDHGYRARLPFLRADLVFFPRVAMITFIAVGCRDSGLI